MNLKVKNKVDQFKKIKDNSQPLFFILGPCAMESEEHTLKIAKFLTELSAKLKFDFIFKSSFDKANRSSISNPRGLGINEGLAALKRVKEEFDIPIVTDIHETCQVAQVAQVADVLQIPAFLCRQTDLLLAAGKTGKIVHLKKGQFLAPENVGSLVKKIESTENQNIWLCERGYSFGYNNLVVDYRNFPIMKEFGKPVIFDVTHSIQRPGGQGNCSGGNKEFIPALAVSAVSQGIAGVFMEVHDNPAKALCDGPNSVPLDQLEGLLKHLIELDAWVKSRKLPVVK